MVVDYLGELFLSYKGKERRREEKRGGWGLELRKRRSRLAGQSTAQTDTIGALGVEWPFRAVPLQFV